MKPNKPLFKNFAEEKRFIALVRKMSKKHRANPPGWVSIPGGTRSPKALPKRRKRKSR